MNISRISPVIIRNLTVNGHPLRKLQKFITPERVQRFACAANRNFAMDIVEKYPEQAEFIDECGELCSHKRNPLSLNKIHQFVTGKLPFPHSNLTPELRNQMREADPLQFIGTGIVLAGQKHNIPESLYNSLFITISPMDNNFMMGFSPTQGLKINSNLYNSSHHAINYCYITHEMTHMKQFLDILRTEDVGERFIEDFADHDAYMTATNMDENFIKANIQYFEDLKNPNNVKFYNNLLEIYKNNPDEARLNLYDALESNYKTGLKSIKDVAEQELGVIPANSKEAKKFNKMSKYFVKGSDLDNAIKSYVNEPAETEADMHGLYAFVEFLFPHFSAVSDIMYNLRHNN